MTYFITATDTDTGKTFVTKALLQAFSDKGYKTLGVKPIASGCVQTSEGLRNQDALQLIDASSVKRPYEQINPYAFEPAIAPHIAAKQAGINLEVAAIVDKIQQNSGKCEILMVEGVGGWLVPLNQTQSMADLARALAFPVILVVNMRLGCINHALLTVQAIEQSGLPLAGWIANTGTNKPPMEYLQDNIDTLNDRIKSPLLGILPPLAQQTAEYKNTFTQIANTLLTNYSL